MKIWPILIAALLVTLVFASGCIGDTEDAQPSGEDLTEQTSEQQPEEETSEDISVPEFEDNH